MTLIPPFLRQKTCTPEMDLSGTVAHVWTSSGSTKGRFENGDKVVAMLPANFTIPTGTGALADYVLIPANYAVKKAINVTLADAAGCMLAGLTAHEMVKASGVKAGDRVLVNAASGGIGTMVVQMLRHVVGSEGYIVGICSGKNAELVKSLGADEVVDYIQHPSLGTYLRERFGSAPLSAVLDTRGHQDLYLASPAYLFPSGPYVSVGIKPPTFFVPDFLRAVWQMKCNEWWPLSPWLGGVGRIWVGISMMQPKLEDGQAVIDMLARAEVSLVRHGVWKFEDVKEAYRKLAEGHARGKIVVRVDGEVGKDEC